ncbi:11495_t:CDS:2, partial [Dentiscutata erythropus]
IPQRKQNPVEKQLAVVLYRLGGKATIWDICSKFGIAEGTVPLFTSRIIKTLKNLKEDFIIWPRASVHDAKVFRNSSLYRYRNQLFEESDYVLADSAYPISLNIIPSFKNPSGLDKTKQIAFNKKHSKSRVVVEQAFGRLKSRFQLLKELRTKSTKIATDLIEISLILHNILEKSGDEWEEPSEQILLYRMQFDASHNTRRTQAIKEAGNIKRQNLMDIVIS